LTIKSIPSNLTNFLISQKISSIGIRKIAYKNLDDWEKAKVKSLFVMRNRGDFYELKSNEAEERLKYSYNFYY